MADELRLDIIIDEHGGTKKLADLDAGVNKVVGSASQATPQVEKLSGGFLGMAGNISKLAIGVGVAIPVLSYLSTQLRAAAEDARKFTDAAKDLESDAQRLNALTVAAAGSRVGFDQMIGGLQRLQERIGSGKLNDELKDLHINLDSLKQSDIAEQFLQITEAIAAIDAPLDRAAMKARVFGGDAQEMGRLAKAGFRDTVDTAETMSAGTIAAFDAMQRRVETTLATIANSAKVLLAETAMYFVDPLGRGDLNNLGRSDLPGLPSAPGGGQPAGLPAPDLERAESQMRYLEALHEEEENLFRIDAVMRNIADAQKIVAKSGGDWADILNTRVSTAVDSINSKLVNAVMLNSKLAGNAITDRDQLTAELTAVTDPNASEFDKKFNAIDQRHKSAMSQVDQTDRVSAAAAENAIWERTNLEIQKLQQQWDGVLSKQDDAITKAGSLAGAYAKLPGSMGGQASSGGGYTRPDGTPLTASSVELAAMGRVFGGQFNGGAVTVNGQPAAHGGGPSVTTNNISVNASGSVFESVEDFVRRMGDGIAERARSQGAKTGR